jgi:hypothetical protein
LEEFKNAIKRLKVKTFSVEFYKLVNQSIEKRYVKCLESDKKYKVSQERMSKKFE